MTTPIMSIDQNEGHLSVINPKLEISFIPNTSLDDYIKDYKENCSYVIPPEVTNRAEIAKITRHHKKLRIQTLKNLVSNLCDKLDVISKEFRHTLHEMHEDKICIQLDLVNSPKCLKFFE